MRFDIVTAKKYYLHQFDFKAMGCPCLMHVYAENMQQAQQFIMQAVREVQRLDLKYSSYRTDNFMARINDAAQQGAVIEIDKETQALLELAEQCYRQSDGLFDISSGALHRVWHFNNSDERVQTLPAAVDIVHCLQVVGWQYLQRKGNQLRFLKKNMAIDFGGLVKEYAVDRIVALFRNLGVLSAMVDLGGDIGVMGERPDAHKWRIYIRHPRRQQQHFACFEIAQGGLASSGDYERFVEIEGSRYSHILSPKTGWPVSGLAAVTVHAQRCVLAGSLATIAMLKEQEGASWLAALGVSHAWMDMQQQAGGSYSNSQNAMDFSS